MRRIPLILARSACWLLFFGLSWSGCQLFAQSPPIYPSWWASYGILNGNPPNDYAAANQGQAKNFAVAAVNEFDTDLAQFGGAGSQLDQLAATLMSGTSNYYTAVNLGQLKALTQPFYDRLLAIGYKRSPFVVTGTHTVYPWIGSEKTANDYAVANLGQLKYLFSFDVNYSSTGNGIPDWWLENYFPGHPPATINPNTYVAWSDSKVTIKQAYKRGLNPLDYYNGLNPTLKAMPGSVLGNTEGGGNTLSVLVSDPKGHPLSGAPIRFSIDRGLVSVPGASFDSASQAVQVAANLKGIASISTLMPWWPNEKLTVSADAVGTTSSLQFEGKTAQETIPTVRLPKVASEPNLPEPDLYIQVSSTTVSNNAFRQFQQYDRGTGTFSDAHPIRYYLQQDATAHYYYFSWSYSEINKGTYQSNGTYDPIRRKTTWNGYSQYEASARSLSLGSSGQGTSTADQKRDGSWRQPKIVCTPGWDFELPTTSPPFPLVWGGWTGSGWNRTMTQSRILQHTDETCISKLPHSVHATQNYHDTVSLSQEYSRTDFLNDTISLLGKKDRKPDVSRRSYPGTQIAWQYLAVDAEYCGVARGTYQFKCRQTVSEPLPFDWYEIFQPYDTNLPIHAQRREWNNAGLESESPLYTIEPSSKGGSGFWYIARLDVQEPAKFPGCQWRHTIGIGETVTLTIDGPPQYPGLSAIWYANPPDAGTLKPGVTSNGVTYAVFSAGRRAGNVRITAFLQSGAPARTSTPLFTTLKIETPGTLQMKWLKSIPFSRGEAGAGMLTLVKYLSGSNYLPVLSEPEVSFANIEVVERTCRPSDITGYFKDSHSATWHNPNGVSNSIKTPDPTVVNTFHWAHLRPDNTLDGHDTLSTGSIDPFQNNKPFGNGGGFKWFIPIKYRLNTDLSTDEGDYFLKPCEQDFSVDADGTTEVRKGGAYDTRQINDVEHHWPNAN